MRLLKKMISAFLVACMVISMLPMVAVATETGSGASTSGRIILDQSTFSGYATVWIDGVEYAVQNSGESCYVDLPADSEPGSMVTYSYHIGDAADIHTQYPIGMQVWELNKNADGSYTPEKVEELNNILQYSGSSIRITGNKGIRMITSIERNKKSDLTSGGLAGYKLLEYGTVLAWSSNLAGGNPLVLGRDYAKSNYAYKKGVADPVFAYAGNLMQHTNVLVGFTLDECKDDIAMRPYMILEDEHGEQMTIYGGIVHRSIGYIAWQNKDVFTPGSAAYNYVWEIIRHVYAEVTFQTNGGSPVESIFVEKGAQAQMPANPEREGYSFAGWYTDEALTAAFDFTAGIHGDLTLYGKWNANDSSRPTMPENPSEADIYYFNHSEVIDVIIAEESEDVPTGAEAADLLAERGFVDFPITYEFTMSGQYAEDAKVPDGSANKFPMYETTYISSSGEVWTVFVINGAVFANPVSFNLEFILDVQLLFSESETLTSYDNETGKYYVTIPNESEVIVRAVERIDADTLDRLTIEEIS